MKPLAILLLIASFITACNNDVNIKENNHTDHDTTSPATSKMVESDKIEQVKPSFSNLDRNVSVHIKEVFNHYIHVKTALVNSDAAEAKAGANALVKVLRGFDKSLLPAEQKAAYDKSIGSMKVSATNIASASDIEKQREHFATLSMQAYELAKSFGAGKTIYHEHCPMAFNDKGALWLSESKDIQNPYFGEKMMECGTVEEIIENQRFK